MKEITNIVIYYSTDDKGIKTTKSCIFYSDGVVAEGNKEAGIKAIHELATQKGIKNKDELRKVMNKDTFYILSEKEFKERYDSFLPQKAKVNPDEFTEKFKESVSKLEKYNMSDIKKAENQKFFNDSIVVVDAKTAQEQAKDELEEYEVVNEETVNEDSEYTDFSLNHNSELEDSELADQEESKESILTKAKEKITKKTTSVKEKIKNSNKDTSKALKTIAGLLAITVGVIGAGHVLKRCSKEGTMTNSNITTTTNTTTVNPVNPIYETIKNGATGSVYTVQSNDLYNDYTFTELLNVTNNEFQKGAMINVSSSLTGFNGIFAKNYIESGHDIKAALSFDEVVALQQAYNNYSIDQVRSYFNGYEVNAIKMSNDYKNASLQLMGAYVIESKENPVDMTILIDNQEGKDFYNKYHTMYMNAKYAEGEEQLKLVNEFYKAVREDFPITEEERTEGISHSESHSKLKDYQLAVAPMIAAAEMIFQNLDVDYTLNDLEVDFINDIGLCNHADDKFERLETIMLGSYEDDTNPLYEQYRNAIIADLVKSGEYVIDDAHRELSNLRRFQQIVNHDPLWKHRNGEYNGDEPVNTNNNNGTRTTTTTKTWTETNTSTRTETSTETAPIPDDEKKKIDDETDKENEEAKKRAEEEAEQERQRQQEEENKNAEDINKAVEEENKKTQEDIDNANKQIDENNKDNDKSNDKPVNEKDINNADIDDKHTDGQGNVDGSVKNITTDGSGADKDLPDPNKSGEEFDKKKSTNTAVATPTPTPKPTQTPKHTESVEVTDGRAEIEYDKEYQDYDADGNPVKGKTRKLVKVKGN